MLLWRLASTANAHIFMASLASSSFSLGNRHETAVGRGKDDGGGHKEDQTSFKTVSKTLSASPSHAAWESAEAHLKRWDGSLTLRYVAF